MSGSKLKMLAIALLAVLSLAGLPSAAHALDLSTAKAQGLVGERPDGMVGIVGQSTPQLRSLVEQVNSQRLERYRDIAAKQGVPAAQVQAITGDRLIQNAPAGSYVMDASGKWIRK
ncbi:YdbL family protein [Telmatospirillum sp. J64-1]|uniref:YdbL family protein n=1 Tax=Telmatospirillum sp. J64-1 TaxID=2502183 RepID=UPI002105AAFE|nr:YdbL family protein [Telmatospirillum sp. J64-1]